LSIDEAAKSIALSRDAFEARVLPTLRSVRLGRRRIVAVAELQKWLDRHADRPLESEFRR
jgi:hypothetical protein